MCSSCITQMCRCPFRVIRETQDHLDRKDPREVKASRAAEVHVETKGRQGSRLLFFLCFCRLIHPLSHACFSILMQSIYKIHLAMNRTVQGHSGAVGSSGRPGAEGQKVCQWKKQFQSWNYISKCIYMYRNPAVNTFHRVNQVLVVRQVHRECLDQAETQELKGPKVRRGYWDRL